MPNSRQSDSKTEVVLLIICAFESLIPLYLDNGRDELQQKSRQLEQRWEEAVQEVHDEALDVRSVVILVGHDHQVAVTQGLGVLVDLRRGQRRRRGVWVG